MKLETFNYTQDKGWSVESFPKMDSENTLILAFISPELAKDLALLEELSKQYPKSKMIGCSTAGEISGSRITDNSISVAVAQFDKTRIEILKTPVSSSEDSLQAGEEISKKLDAPDLRSILVLSDGLNVNGTELVKGLNKINKPNVVITGGLAGDGDRFKETWVIYDGKTYKNTVAALALYGEAIQIGFSSQGGWDIFGPERYITRSKGNVLYELDGQPALTLYKKYLGERAEGLPSTGLLFPLSIRSDQKDSRHLVRTILAVDEEKQSLTFAGDMPTGNLAQLMKANFDRLIASAGEAGEEAAKKIHIENPGPILSIAISCVGRRLLLGERTEEETEYVLETLPKGTLQVGFYSYGELSPLISGSCDLHNQTMTLTTLYES
ncbi:MAG: FIST C-terminal domain-containing protein [Alphaproteobacteria bacterium]|nr:FIST C-terminal domain-containing protein [Alphaproteobacteria bacterium]